MKTKELRELSVKELEKRARQLREEHFQLRLQHSGGQLEDTSKLPAIKKEIARIETLLGEQQRKAAQA